VPYTPVLVPVAGFLGAGKTTLILAASRILQERGFKAAAILNDQGGELVDTAHLLQLGVAAGEVAGACFCCRFSELLFVADNMRALGPDVIFLEPVGSCTDLAAAVMRPLLAESEGRYQIAPMTVLVDPERLASSEDPSIRFLLEKQLAEADLVVSSKSDLQHEIPELRGRPVRSLSARTGEGVRAWLDEVLSGGLPVGEQSLAIDYSIYARAEAALGWLNWSGAIELQVPLSPAELIGPWIEALQEKLRQQQAGIAHLKMLDQAGGAWLKAAATSNDGDPIVEGDLAASPQQLHTVRFNIRAVIDPASLKQLFEEVLDRVPGRKVVTSFQCFSPAPPRPERRLPEAGNLLLA
jgi:hypothetical protein